MARPEANSTCNCKILSVVWFKVLPPKFGGQKAVAFFNKHLAEHAPLVCFCSKANETVNTNYRVQNTLPVGKMQVLNPAVWRKIYAAVKRENITHLILEFPYYGLAGILCKKLLNIKLIVNTHNIEYLRFKEQKNRGWRGLFFLERATLRAADAVFFKTERDLKIAQEKFGLKTSKLSFIPYGVEEKGAKNKAEAQKIIRFRHGLNDTEKILLFTGTLDYAPNADALVDIHEKLIPLLNKDAFSYKIIVCGRNCFKEFSYLNHLQNEHLILADDVYDVENYFAAADVFINPVLSGGGIQTKTMDALSYHLNVVCFASKAVGISAAENKLFVVNDGDWTSFASAIILALKESTPTSAAFFETYNWRSIAAKAYQKIITC